MRETMLIIHFIGLAMGLGTSFGFMFLGFASSKMAPEVARDFKMKTFALSRMGHLGLALLILSGLFLMAPYWDLLSDMPLLIAKLVLVVTLGFLIGIISATARKLKMGDPSVSPTKIENLGKVAMLNAIVIVILAVLIFR